MTRDSIQVLCEVAERLKVMFGHFVDDFLHLEHAFLCVLNAIGLYHGLVQLCTHAIGCYRWEPLKSTHAIGCYEKSLYTIG